VVLYLHSSRCFRDVGNEEFYLHSYFKLFGHNLKIPYCRDSQAVFSTQCGICSQSHSYRILQLVTLTATQTSAKVMFPPPPSCHITFYQSIFFAYLCIFPASFVLKFFSAQKYVSLFSLTPQ